MSNLLVALGRIALVALFVWSGIGKVMAPGGLTASLAAKGLPVPQLLAYAAGITEIVLGTLVAVGWQARLAALGLAAFTVVATLVSHDFWAMTGDARRINMVQAMKNLSIIGGLLLLAVHGPGRWALGRK